MQLWLSSISSVVLFIVSVLGQGGQVANPSIVGTWSSGSQAVITGAGFANPANMSFIYPKNSGVSYAFSQDGYYEIARYRFAANGSMPTCITGALQWVHGTYTLNNNGSITCVPFGDGFQQIQDPCAAQSNFVELYNQTEVYSLWQMFQDPVTGLKLHLYGEDGTPVAPLFQVSTTPNMLPTRVLRSAPQPATTSDGLISSKRGLTYSEVNSKRWTWGWGL